LKVTTRAVNIHLNPQCTPYLQSNTCSTIDENIESVLFHAIWGVESQHTTHYTRATESARPASREVRAVLAVPI